MEYIRINSPLPYNSDKGPIVVVVDPPAVRFTGPNLSMAAVASVGVSAEPASSQVHHRFINI